MRCMGAGKRTQENERKASPALVRSLPCSLHNCIDTQVARLHEDHREDDDANVEIDTWVCRFPAVDLAAAFVVNVCAYSRRVPFEALVITSREVLCARIWRELCPAECKRCAEKSRGGKVVGGRIGLDGAATGSS